MQEATVGALIEERLYADVTDGGVSGIRTPTTLDTEPARLGQSKADKNDDNHVTHC